MDFNAFMSALSLMAKEAEYEGKEWNTLGKVIYKITDHKPKQIVSITYAYSEIYGVTGGSSGSEVQTLKTYEGVDNEEEVTKDAMVAVTAGIKYSSALSPVSADFEISSRYDFSSATKHATHETKETEDTLTIEFDKPTYIYQKSVTINYSDTSQQTIYMGRFVSDKEMAIAETVPYCKIQG